MNRQTRLSRPDLGLQPALAPTVGQVFGDLIHHPVKMLACKWNWKSAVLSTLIRACIFFFTNLPAGRNAALNAMAAEFVYRGLSSGLLGALTEAFREAEPAWLAGVAVMVMLPFFGHSIELAVHWLRGTPQLAFSMVASIGFTAVSSLFNLYAMRRGALIVGVGRQSLTSDLRRMPRLILGFLAIVPRRLFQGMVRLLRQPRPDVRAGSSAPAPCPVREGGD